MAAGQGVLLGTGNVIQEPAGVRAGHSASSGPYQMETGALIWVTSNPQGRVKAIVSSIQPSTPSACAARVRAR